VVAADDTPSFARKMGIQPGQVVQEWGWDEDTDDDIRADAEDACGGELLDEDTDDGVIWVVTPKTGKPGHVLPAEIAEAAPTAGLMPTSSVNLGDWSASRLVQPKSRAARR
jgi:hypothetical protein